MIYCGTCAYRDINKCWEAQKSKLFFLGDHGRLHRDADMYSQIGGRRNLPGRGGNAVEGKEKAQPKAERLRKPEMEMRGVLSKKNATPQRQINKEEGTGK